VRVARSSALSQLRRQSELRFRGGFSAFSRDAAAQDGRLRLKSIVDLYGKDPDRAATVWLAIDTVNQGLEGGNVVFGGLWTLLVSWAALRTEGFFKALICLGVVIGAAGLLTVVPTLQVPVFVFGLGGIVWFVGLAIVMLRGTRKVAA
jgi:hypothetical protein